MLSFDLVYLRKAPESPYFLSFGAVRDGGQASPLSALLRRSRPGTKSWALNTISTPAAFDVAVDGGAGHQQQSIRRQCSTRLASADSPVDGFV